MEMTKLPDARVSVGFVPTWDVDDLTSRPCPVCGSEASTPFVTRPDALVVESCSSCTMLFVKRTPSERQLEAFYQRYATFKGYARREPKPLRWHQLAFTCAQDLYIEALENTGGLRGKSVLDFGCSNGRFLELVRWKGGLPRGVEIDAEARAEGQTLGLEISERAPENGAFDVTTALQVLEHLTAPAELVRTMARLTERAGRIVVAVPNASEVDALGPGWIGFRVDLEHINYFTVRTLAALLRSADLYVEHFWQHRQPALQRTDLEPGSPNPGLAARAGRAAERLYRMIAAPPERFLQGSFTLSMLARRA